MTRRQRLTLIAAILGSAVATIDGSIVNVALPAIARDLGGGLVSQQWVSNAYLLTLGSLILVGGSLGDIYGQRRIFALGVALFGVFSVASALAPTIGVLIAARALQGAAAALLTPASLAVIVGAFSRERPRCGDRSLDGLGRYRLDHRPAGRRHRRRCNFVALDLRAQHPARRSHARAHLCRSARERPGQGTPSRSRRGCPRGAGARRSCLRADRGAALRVDERGDARRARHRHRLLDRLSRLRAAHAAADAEAGFVQAAELRGRRTSRRSRCTPGSRFCSSS